MLVEVSCREYGSRPQREDHRRFACTQKSLQLSWQRRVSRVCVVKAEAGDKGMRWPILLFNAQNAREQSQHQIRRVLGLKEVIPAPRHSQFLAKIVNRLRPFAVHKPR